MGGGGLYFISPLPHERLHAIARAPMEKGYECLPEARFRDQQVAQCTSHCILNG